MIFYIITPPKKKEEEKKYIYKFALFEKLLLISSPAGEGLPTSSPFPFSYLPHDGMGGGKAASYYY